MQGGRRIGRYVLGPAIAKGGMATVHLARMLGQGGFGKTVAIKRLHRQYASEPDVVMLFREEARVTSSLDHANVVMTLDVLEEDDELYLVMEYVHGASLSQILRLDTGQTTVPLGIGVGIAAAMLDGLHAAHEATDEQGKRLDIVHRDVSPQNVLVTFQGVAKLADFGIAKAAGRAQSTGDGTVKGKVGYMAPEQVLGDEMTPRTDIYAAGVVLWEILTGRRLIDFSSTEENVRAVMELEIDPPSTISTDLPRGLDELVLRALERSPEDRFASAKEMALALRATTAAAHANEIGDWLRSERRHLVEMREACLADLQRTIGESARSSSSQISVPATGVEPATVIVRERTDEADASREQPSDRSSWAVGAPPPRARRWLVPSLLVAVGTAGVVASVSVTRRQLPAAPERSVSAKQAATAPSTAVIHIVAEPDATATAAASSAPAPPPATSSSAKPRPAPGPSSSASRRCRIAASTDSVGHTQFTEVCQ